MNTTPPGFRFSRIGHDNEPQHLIDVWLLAEPTRALGYAEHLEQYRAFRKEIDRAFGPRTRFTFVGEIDTREDLGAGSRIGELLDILGLEIMCPVATQTELAVSVNIVPRWPEYCLLLSGLASSHTNWDGVRAYVVRRVSVG